MPSRDWKSRITDILQAVQDIEQFTQEMTFEEFRKNKMVVQSVLYNFVIIGEASANIPDEIQSLDPTIPWRKMSDMRNVMAHEYFQVNLSIVFQTIERFTSDFAEIGKAYREFMMLNLYPRLLIKKQRCAIAIAVCV
jgi:uncharacterized protein with HEPN domain